MWAILRTSRVHQLPVHSRSSMGKMFSVRRQRRRWQAKSICYNRSRFIVVISWPWPTQVSRPWFAINSSNETKSMVRRAASKMSISPFTIFLPASVAIDYRFNARLQVSLTSASVVNLIKSPYKRSLSALIFHIIAPCPQRISKCIYRRPFLLWDLSKFKHSFCSF